MFGATAAIESQNIVGYAGTKLQSGSKIVTPQFLSVSAADGKVDLQNFIPQGENCVDNVFVSKLGPYGDTLITYTWIDYGSEGGAYWTEDGDSKVTKITIDPGEALWVQASSESQSVQSSGQVPTTDIAFQLREGATMVGNPTPKSVDIQTILPSGPNCVDNLFLSKLGPYGDTLLTYTWIDYGSEGGSYWTEDGDSKATDASIDPGEGVWLQASSEEQYVTLPGVEL